MSLGGKSVNIGTTVSSNSLGMNDNSLGGNSIGMNGKSIGMINGKVGVKNAKRFSNNKSNINPFDGIRKPSIRRMCRRGGIKRINSLIYEESRSIIKAFLENLIRDAQTYTEHSKRKTVSAIDVVYALKRQGRTIYGYGK